MFAFCLLCVVFLLYVCAVKYLSNQIKMNNESEIDQEFIKRNLLALYDSLPPDGVRLLAEKSGMTQVYIRRFFKGDFNITEKNSHIVADAIKLKKQRSKMITKLLKDI